MISLKVLMVANLEKSSESWLSQKEKPQFDKNERNVFEMKSMHYAFVTRDLFYVWLNIIRLNSLSFSCLKFYDQFSFLKQNQWLINTHGILSLFHSSSSSSSSSSSGGLLASHSFSAFKANSRLLYNLLKFSLNQSIVFID